MQSAQIAGRILARPAATKAYLVDQGQIERWSRRHRRDQFSVL